MEDVKKEIHLHYEEKHGKKGTVKTLKDPAGAIKFIKIGFGAWEKVEMEVKC